LYAEQPAPPPSVASSIAQEVRGVFQKCHSAVVRIEATDGLGDLSGSGFFIDPNGTLYTSYTIGGTSSELTVTWDGDQYAAKRLVADERSGVAILKIDPNAAVPFLVPGQASDLGLGDPIVVIGFPMDLPVSPSWGTLAGFDMKYLGCYFATRHLRANIAVQRGEGGAPVLNLRGEAVGLLVSNLDNGSACYSLPIEAAERIRKDFVRNGRLRPGWLGIGCIATKLPIDGSSALVETVTPGSPGARAGVKPGDVLLQVGEHPIAAAEDVLDAAFFIVAEDEVKLRLARNDNQLEVSVTAIDPPRPSQSVDPTTYAARG
jgi:serine protease Do